MPPICYQWLCRPTYSSGTRTKHRQRVCRGSKQTRSVVRKRPEYAARFTLFFRDGERCRRGQSRLSRQAFSAAESTSRPTLATSVVALDHNFRIITSDFRIITPGAMGCDPVSDLTTARRANSPKSPGRFPRIDGQEGKTVGRRAPSNPHRAFGGQNWEDMMGRIALLAAAAAAILCLATAPSMRAQAQGFYPVETCVFPPWYPRGWELMVRCPPSYYQPYYPRRASYRYRV